MAPDHTNVPWTTAAAVLFDLDGVVTPTATVHERAWAELFADFDYTRDDYLRSIDGRPRDDGVRTFLASRGETRPEGSPDDPPDADTVHGMGNRKNDLFMAVLERDGVAAYPGTLAVLDVLDGAGVPAAIVSSSQNARAVLAAAGLTERFDPVVDGITARTAPLAGKPDPAMFLHAARLLDAPVERSVVVEDASAGVAAGVAGGFSVVVGVDRGGNADALAAAGATIVVRDLAETLPGVTAADGASDALDRGGRGGGDGGDR